MTISPNRIRYLDKENKILVQDFSDIAANVPMSNVDTPMTIEAMDAIDEGFRLLQSLERDLMSLVNALSDENIGRFLIDTLLNNFRLNLPGFPQVAAFINSLRGMDSVVFGGFINALIAEASNSIFDNPSLINMKTGNTQQQVVNIAITNFAKKLDAGQIDQGYIQRLSNYGTGDPYAISSAVNKLNNDYKYTVNEQDKFKLPTDARVGRNLICFLSLSLGYYNYLYSKIKLDGKATVGPDFVTSIENETDFYRNLNDELRAEASRISLDLDSLVYYLEQIHRVVVKFCITKIKTLDIDTQTVLLNKYLANIQTVLNSVTSGVKQRIGNTVYDAFKNPTTGVFLGNLIGRIRNNTLVLDSSLDPTAYTNKAIEVQIEYVNYLRSSLLAYLKTGKPSKDISNVYTLINARNTLYKSLIEQRTQLTKTQLATLFSILEVFYTTDIYLVEGDSLLQAYQIRLTSPISTYTKVTTESLYTTCLNFFRLMDRQFYTLYPKDGSTGLLANAVDKMNQVKMDLVDNNFYIRDVVTDVDATYEDLVPVLTPTLLQSAFYPLSFNNYDGDIYNLYKRSLWKFVFSAEDATVVQ